MPPPGPAAPAASPRSLAEDLRARDDDALAALLRARPDLASPPPSGTSGLAARAGTRTSAQRAVDRLDAPSLAVLEVVVALPEPVASDDVARACGATTPAAAREVIARVDAARTAALLWGTPDALHPVRAVVEVIGPTPAGLGPSLREALGTRSPARVAELAQDLGVGGAGDPVADLAAVAGLLGDPDHLAALLAGAPPAARELLDRLTWGPPTGAVTGAERAVRIADAATPLEWLLARGVLAPAGPTLVVLPAEVAISLRGGVVVAGLPIHPPELEVVAQRPDLVDGSASTHATEAVRCVELLLDGWSAAPPPILRAGGLGVRELRRVADRLEVDTDQAAFWVELVRAAGLAADDGEADPAWAPTPAFDTWRDLDVPARWAHLAAAWVATSRVPGLVGEKDAKGGVRAALADDADRTSAPLVRRGVLTDLASLPAGGAASAASLLARLRWRTPRRAGALAERLVAWTLREAAWLGVTGAGALSGAGRALASSDAAGAGDAAAARALAAALPEPVDHVLLQADLTAVAPGPLRPEVAARLGLLADVDSRGGATVYRFSPGSVRRALDAGQGADDITTFLAGHSSTPVPQALTVLVADVARRYGRVRVGVASAYLRSDDETALTEVLADRRAASLGLRRLAPTVAAARADPTKVLEVLRSMGAAPAVESGDGDVVLPAGRSARSPVRERPRPVTGEPPEVTESLVAAILASVRTADAAGTGAGTAADAGPVVAAGSLDVPPPLVATQPPTALAALREAARDHRPVWVGICDAAGRTSVSRLAPVDVQDGMVTALDMTTGQVRTLSVHRVTGVAPA